LLRRADARGSVDIIYRMRVYGSAPA